MIPRFNDIGTTLYVAIWMFCLEQKVFFFTMPFITPNSCSIRWSNLRSSPPLTKKWYSFSSVPFIVNRLGLLIEDIIRIWLPKLATFTCNSGYGLFNPLYWPGISSSCYYLLMIKYSCIFKKLTSSKSPLLKEDNHGANDFKISVGLCAVVNLSLILELK